MRTKDGCGFRWVIVGLLFFITLVNYIDRASISYAVGYIADTFHLNDTQIGFILGAFGVGYIFTTLLGGIAVDRYGTKKIMSMAVLCWTIALLLTGLATGFLMLFTARVLLGLAEGPNFPGMTRVVSDWLNENERTRALSYALIAVPIGLAIGSPLISFLIAHYSWRLMFYILAGLSLIWLPFWWIFFADFPDQSKWVKRNAFAISANNDLGVSSATSLEKRRNISGLWKFLSTDTTLLANYWAFFVFGYYLFFFMNWLPSYLEQSYHMNLQKLGIFGILPWTLGAIFMWIVGTLSDKLYLKTQDYRISRTYIICLSQLLAALCIFPVVLTNHLYVALIFISLAVGFILSANGAYYAVNIDVAKERAGTALGVMDAVFAASGFIAPVITGWSVSSTGQFKAAFLLLTSLSFSSIILLLTFHHPKSNNLLEKKE